MTSQYTQAATANGWKRTKVIEQLNFTSCKVPISSRSPLFLADASHSSEVKESSMLVSQPYEIMITCQLFSKEKSENKKETTYSQTSKSGNI